MKEAKTTSITFPSPSTTNPYSNNLELTTFIEKNKPFQMKKEHSRTNYLSNSIHFTIK